MLQIFKVFARIFCPDNKIPGVAVLPARFARGKLEVRTLGDW